jgi:hypothetical protein
MNIEAAKWLKTESNTQWLKTIETGVGNFENFYQTLSPEMVIWFWIGAVVGTITLITVTILLFRATIKALNTVLQSKDGWRPIQFYTCMWAGTALSAIAFAYHTKITNQPGWSVILAIGSLILISFVWFMIKRLRIIKAIGASIINFSLGAIVAPVVIQLSLLLIFMVLALIVFYIWTLFQPRTVYVVDR